MRKQVAAAVLLSSTLALPALAQTADIRFLPPNPTSQTPVIARLSGEWPATNVPRSGQATVTAQAISVRLDCISPIGGQAITPWQVDVSIGLLQPGRYEVTVHAPPVCPPGSSVPPVLATARLIVADATPAFEITPNVMENSQSESVIVSSPSLVCRDTQLCAAPEVRFGNQPATLVRVDPALGRVEVIPPVLSGTVDVAVTSGNQLLRRVAAFHYADSSEPPLPEFFTPVLLPVFFSAPGAFGSLWDTEVSVFNGNDHSLRTPWGSLFHDPCAVCSPPPPPPIAAQSGRIIGAAARAISLPSGSLMHLARQGAHKVEFGLLVRDLSRQAEALGTEVPVVREEDLREGSFSLLNIPGDNRFRSSLRIYSIDKTERVRVRMRIRSMDTDSPLVDVSLPLAATGIIGQTFGYAAIGDLAAAYPQIRGRGPLRIEILPNTPGDLRLWAFVTVTNNQTQHVTVISPQ